LSWQIQKPGRYVATEVNARRKDYDSAGIRFVLAFPDVYEIGMSHLGLHVLYHLLNGMEGVMADRAYAPWLDYEAHLRERREPLRGHESRRPLRDFDFVGFSLQYELSYTNILTMLDLGRVPLRSRDRGPGDPWVIAGGPCAFNPEPLADLLDFVVLGEAEEVLAEVVSLHGEWRDGGGSRADFLRAVSGIAGVYVPSFFDVGYSERSGTVCTIEPRLEGYESVSKRLVMDLDRLSPTPVRPLVPMGDIIHNRLSIEIARGCTRGCRFCQAGYIYRPVRERRPEAVLAAAREALRHSGFEELSLLSFSTGDYCQVQWLLSALVDRLAGDRVAVSFPSMRVGTLTPELMEMVRRVRKTGFTLAPEAGSERLRRVINKPVTDEDLVQTAENAFALGWKVLKLYFMIGLPTEEGADLEAMVHLSHQVWRIARKKKASLNVSVSTFVPKPHTPFQWHPQLSRESIRERIEFLKDRLSRPGLRLKWNEPDQSALEAVFARGDRRLAEVIEKAYGLGARFDGWSEHFRPDVWERAFGESGLDPRFYAERARPRDEVFPWRHLSSGVEQSFLLAELDKSLAEALTPDCRWEACSACGVCDHRTVFPQLHEAVPPDPPGSSPHVLHGDRGEGQFLYLIQYSKLDDLRFYGQLEIAQSLIRAVRRSGLPAAYSSGFHPHLKLSFEEALPLGMESLAENAVLTLRERVEPEVVRIALAREMPDGLRVMKVSVLRRKPERSATACVTYRLSGIPPELVDHLVHAWGLQPEGMLIKETKRGRITAPLHDVLRDFRRIDEHTIEMDLLEGKNLCFRPASILRTLLKDEGGQLEDYRVCKMSVSPWGDQPGRSISVPDVVERRCSECPPRSS
jgi:radical SAM family uncharacterized protein/radical SAM-linked protein